MNKNALKMKFQTLANQWHLTLTDEVMEDLLQTWEEIEVQIALVKNLVLVNDDFSNTLTSLTNTHLAADQFQKAQPAAHTMQTNKNWNSLTGVKIKHVI